MKTFGEFVNEGVRTMMTPKSKSDIRELLDNDNNLVNRVKYIMDNDLQYLYTEEELKELIERAMEFMTFAEQSKFAIRYCFVWIIEDILKEGYYDYPSITKTALNDVRTINYADEEFEFEGYEERVKIRNKIAELIKERNKRFKKKDIKLIESVRDKMTPKSKEDIERSLNTLPLVKDRLVIADRLGIKYDIMKNSYSVSANEFLKLSVERHLLDGVKEAVLRGSHRSYAMRLCAEHGFYDGVKWLLENGANPYANDSEAFRIAENNPSIRSLMKQYRKNPVPYNESVRDKMTPRSDAEVRRGLVNMSSEDIIKTCRRNGLRATDYLSDGEINSVIERMLEGDIDRVLKQVVGIMDIFGMEYPDELYCSVLGEMDFDLLKEHLGGILDSIIGGSYASFVGDVIAKHRKAIENIRTHRELFDIPFKISEEIGDVYYRDEILRQLIKLNDIDKTRDIIRRMLVYGVNEGVRDRMTPKPREAVRKALYGYFANNIATKTEELLAMGLFDDERVKGKKIYIIYDYDDHYVAVDKYFRSLTMGQESYMVGEYEYRCFPGLGVVEYFDYTLSGWYFVSDHLDGVVEYVLGDK